MRKQLLAAASLALAAPATAAEPTGLPRLEGRIVLAGCRQGQCAWIRITGLARVGTVPQGELRRIALRRGFSRHPDGSIPANARRARIDWDAGTRTDFVFCSTARPAYAFQDEGGALVTHYLDLFDLAGYQASSGTLYMRFCHDQAFSARALRALGYRPGTRSEQVENGTVQALTRF